MLKIWMFKNIKSIAFKKKYYLFGIFIILASVSQIYSQTTSAKTEQIQNNKFNIYMGMGIGLISTSSFTDYLRDEIPYSNQDTIKSFSSVFEVFGGIEYSISRRIAISFDYSYLIKTVNYQYTYLSYDYFYYMHQSNLELLYKISKKNYNIKFGGGLGYTYCALEQELSPSNSVTYSSSGLSFRGDFIFAPMLSEKFGMYLDLNVAGNSLSSLKNGNDVLTKVNGEEVNLNNIRFGIRMGVLFTI